MRDEFEALSKLDEMALTEYLISENHNWIEHFDGDFTSLAHAHQRAPGLANSGADWTTWLILGGRGAGKTRAGAEWVRSIALIGETEHEVGSVMVEGVSGLLAVHRHDERPQWTPTLKRVEWSSGAVAEIFSAENFEALRGPQFSAAWLDELAKWRQAEATFDMLQFGLRRGERPRQVVTTTPRPIALLKKLIDDPRTAVTHAGTRTNAYNLAAAFVGTVLARY
jgi:phage terminase large subunit-like protein